MGYFKNEDATRKTIDQFGYLHSGDMGKLDAKGNLIITGRLKELIITAGGENVAPVLIENVISLILIFRSLKRNYHFYLAQLLSVMPENTYQSF